VTLLQILVVLVVVAAVAAVAAGMLRGGGAGEAALAEPTTTVPALQLPAERLTDRDLEQLRFSLGFRGYRMDEVDQVLDRLADELHARDAQLAELRERLEAAQLENSQPESSQLESTPLESTALEDSRHLEES
jgi:DivIVA domain-containing protein